MMQYPLSHPHRSMPSHLSHHVFSMTRLLTVLPSGVHAGRTAVEIGQEGQLAVHATTIASMDSCTACAHYKSSSAVMKLKCNPRVNVEERTVSRIKQRS